MARLTLALVDYAAAIGAVYCAICAIQAGSPLALAAAGGCLAVACLARSVSESRARARHIDDVLGALRAGSRSSRLGEP